MKKERILEMIDNNIIKMLNDQSFDQVRSKLFYTSKKFRQRLNTDFNIIDIDKVKDSRTKYTMMYIDLSEKRIADLVRIEFGENNLSPLKKFSLLLFKEKLNYGSKNKISVSKKYLKFLN